MINPDELKEFHVFGACVLWAGVCGTLSYLLKVQEGHVFRWTEFVLHTAASSVAGVIAYQLLPHWGAPPDLSGALCGLAGWMGTRAMKLFEILVLKKVEVDEKSLEKNEDEVR